MPTKKYQQSITKSIAIRLLQVYLMQQFVKQMYLMQQSIKKSIAMTQNNPLFRQILRI